jgi:PAS domain S-box-containing protein
MHPDDAPVVAEEFHRVLGSPGSVGHAEYRFQHKDGTWRHLEAFGRTLSPTSAEQGLVANVRDVTERIEVQRALRERDEHFRRIIENTSDYVMTCNTALELTYVSPSATALLGYAPEEMLGSQPGTLIHPDDLAAVQRDITRIAEQPGESVRTEYRIRHKDGSWRVFESVGRTIASHTFDDGMIAIARDVTDRKAAQDALQRSEEHFRRLIENGSDIILVCDTEGGSPT